MAYDPLTKNLLRTNGAGILGANYLGRYAIRNSWFSSINWLWERSSNLTICRTSAGLYGNKIFQHELNALSCLQTHSFKIPTSATTERVGAGGTRMWLYRDHRRDRGHLRGTSVRIPVGTLGHSFTRCYQWGSWVTGLTACEPKIISKVSFLKTCLCLYNKWNHPVQ